MIRRITLAVMLMIGLNLVGPQVETALACPMCKVANEQDAQLPRAYMYSILFMMGMIFSLGGGVGVGLYLLSRKEDAALAGLEGGAVDPAFDAPSTVRTATT